MRRIDLVMISRGLYLFYFGKSKRYVAQHTGFSDLVEKAKALIMERHIDDSFFEPLNISIVDLNNEGIDPYEEGLTWIEVAVRLVPGMTPDESTDVLGEVLQEHQRIAVRMATHLQLTAANICRSTWMSAHILSKNAELARASANAFHEHLIRLRPAAATPYEKHWLETDALMRQLYRFKCKSPPCLLWHNDGAYSEMFIFLAIRFLSEEDSVLDCESIHAEWKWLEELRRGMKFKMLNALLKIKRYLQDHGEQLPPSDALSPHIAAWSAGMRQQYEELARDGTIARGLRSDFLYRDRFNLSPADVEILKARVGTYESLPRTPQVAWGFYLRFLFQPNTFYRFEGLLPDRYVFVAESKSFPGRDQPLLGEAAGRPLSIAWFEAESTTLQGVLVSPVNGHDTALQLMDASVAEIVRAAGHFPPAAHDATPRDVELRLEKDFLDFFLVRLKSQHVPFDSSRPWSFMLSEPVDIEEYFIARTPVEDLSKIALARQLQLREGLNDEQRNQRWQLVRDALLRQYNPVAAARAAATAAARAAAKAAAKAAAAPVGGRGRGRGLAAAPAAGGRGLAAAPAAGGRGGGRGLGAAPVGRGNGRGGRVRGGAVGARGGRG